jgi:integrase/recombinase XerD
MRGAPIHLVQQTLGHRSLATTQQYLHVRPGEGSSQYLAAPRSEPAKPL